ncbi:hypothetical protein GGTG_00515 [Gaeumannomyces tritici R3-111a-1]|uniref:Uncharacterized protein n=1 Tax=Gaeumannomyces tritici (strain R3-111a-1) TaxID=644352 RepID=J3NGX9_GAET3|nr:hypothetical protein GGTG_00515 [Gaeumannomyces tritici R3-111a-1]EJT80519.1 hypothetical protein GGTG_00515 [Gaeumannomyces tritici R3-111a-1]
MMGFPLAQRCLNLRAAQQRWNQKVPPLHVAQALKPVAPRQRSPPAIYAHQLINRLEVACGRECRKGPWIVAMLACVCACVWDVIPVK